MGRINVSVYVISFADPQCRVKSVRDIAVDGVTPARAGSQVREYQQAGATWWFEIVHQLRGTQEELEQRIQAGPPR